MKAFGFVVISVDDGPAVSADVRVDTDNIFATITYNGVPIESAHPEHRALMDEILETLQRQGDRRDAVPFE